MGEAKTGWVGCGDIEGCDDSAELDPGDLARLLGNPSSFCLHRSIDGDYDLLYYQRADLDAPDDMTFYDSGCIQALTDMVESLSCRYQVPPEAIFAAIEHNLD